MRAELNAIGECNAQITLEPHKAAFDKLLKEFKHMKPLLVKIKDAYDKALFEAQLEANEVAPLRSLVSTIAEDCERRVLQIKQHEKDEIINLKQENGQLKKHIEILKSKEMDLETQVKRLGEEVGDLYAKYRQEKTARRLFISDMNAQKVMTEQNIEINDFIDPVHMKLAVEQTRKDLTVAQQTITQMEIDYAEVVSKKLYDNLVEKFEKSEEERISTTKNLAQLKSEFKILKETFDQVELERNEAVKVCDDLGRSGTPRPDWELVTAHMDSVVYKDSSKSTKNKVAELINDLNEAKTAGGPDYISIPSELPEDYPDYLKTDKTNVRNRKLTPVETAAMMKELWKAKIAVESDVKWADFLPNELQKQYNNAKDEFLLSFHYSLQKYKQTHAHFENLVLACPMYTIE